MALYHLAYERLLSAIHNENTQDQYFNYGRRLGRLLYEGRWYDPEAMLLKEGVRRWVASPVSGTVTFELRCGDDYTILDTRPEYSAYDPDKLSMEKTEGAFSPEDRIGALEVKGMSVVDSRNLLVHMIDSSRRFATREPPSLQELIEPPPAEKETPRGKR